ncbi:MAG: class I SAM-dependent methyltransferase [Candidatus Magasanikbacteria bacterium]|jgi:SAM-dependent methyltransferase|nr:class I SAM-dependent methyltransferase [Candidatus Magasanikbacteria bacterium]MBT4350524.1 class I SAM-dependent methyltransferase [Candidatus Magasanikbacteria bacterium]MBT4541923.1 class I SAM-dependent methyltransferase [Candidatus Magasanikbacteria bacterium]MBT6253054.1 class I SAM-dependent methyltransferase [Candidatus Magasanikbacteria bacterium]MBT6334426.1 class I SAM-dependent methyltransferase [Candidatus Magasanikbacteria bacterium]
MAIFFGIILFFLITIAIGAVTFAPWVPAYKEDISRISDLAKLKDGDVFYDLGCGNGRVVFAVAKNCDVQAIGIEIAFPLYLFCVFRRWFFPYKHRVKYRWRNLFFIDVSSADVVYVYGLPETLSGKVAKKLRQELRPGTCVLSYAFPIAVWKPIHVDKPQKENTAIYVYEI